MNNKFLWVILWLVHCALCATMQAQTLNGELKKIRNAYLNAKQLSFNVEAYSYSTKMDKTHELVSKGYMKKSGDKYYSNFNKYELMINGEKALVVDRERKTLDYYEYERSKQEIPEGYQVNIDSLVTGMDSIAMRPLQNGLIHFTCFSKNGYVRQTEIYADAQTHFIQRILYYYIESNEDFEMEFDRMEIFYKNIQTNPIDPVFFSFDKYFKKTKSTITPVGDYRGYQMNAHSTKR